jgi:protein O-mannosyl-transferase
VLYAFFFLASVICYLKYISENRKGFFALSLLLFLLSLLSKAMAASLPVALLVIDFLRGRKFTAKVLLEKLPFLFLAIVLGIVALKAQHSDSAIHVEVAPFPRPMIYASYGFITYIIKILLPFQQSAYYPYPANPQESVPVMYFISLLSQLGSGFGRILDSIRPLRGAGRLNPGRKRLRMAFQGAFRFLPGGLHPEGTIWTAS